jgi:hypothetical protein
MDTSNVNIKIAPKIVASQIPLNPVALDPKKQQQVLQQRYEKFRKGRK